MSRLMLAAARLTVLLPAIVLPAAVAQERLVPIPAAEESANNDSADNNQSDAASARAPGYVQLHAAMYPAPKPNVPIWAGSTFITNQALAPHEMTYPHSYRAIYPPFYHRVRGHYKWTPFGIHTHEKWELQGTLVEVNYRSHFPTAPFFKPSHTSRRGGPYQ